MDETVYTALTLLSFRSSVHSSTVPPKSQPMSSYRDQQVKEDMRAADSYGSISSSSRQPPRVPSGTLHPLLVASILSRCILEFRRLFVCDLRMLFSIPEPWFEA